MNYSSYCLTQETNTSQSSLQMFYLNLTRFSESNTNKNSNNLFEKVPHVRPLLDPLMTLVCRGFQVSE